MVFHKRKYHTLHSKQQITLKHIDGLSAYQSMAPAACVAALNTALDNKCSCVCFAPPMQIMPYTHNTVSTVHIAVGTVKLDLEFIARSLRYSTYDRKRFAAITIRISNPKITALLFSSGKLVVTGAVSKQMAMNATRQIIGNLRRLYRLSRMSYSHHLIQNIVCNVCVPNIMTIDISRIYKDRNNLCTYQPKIFPGLIFRPSRSPIVLLIFKSSRIIVTGCTRPPTARAPAATDPLGCRGRRAHVRRHFDGVRRDLLRARVLLCAHTHGPGAARGGACRGRGGRGQARAQAHC